MSHRYAAITPTKRKMSRKREVQLESASDDEEKDQKSQRREIYRDITYSNGGVPVCMVRCATGCGYLWYCKEEKKIFL